MLTPLLVQYVVGLCCLRNDPEAVNVVIGDMVLDNAADKRRDVDVTVTVREKDGAVRAFKAYEVKREADPVDVTIVEQLCLKLLDMPSVTHRGIVSASGFTDGAIKKATAHNVELFAFRPWTRPIGEQFAAFQGIGAPQEFLVGFSSNLLHWADYTMYLIAPGGPPTFRYDNSGAILTRTGAAHSMYANLQALGDAIALRSTTILWPHETSRADFVSALPDPTTGVTVGPSWSHSHTLDVAADDVYLQIGDTLVQLQSVTLSGHLHWVRRFTPPQFYILERAPTGEAFAGAALADWGSPPGKMFAMVFSPTSRTTGIHTIMLEAKHQNAIRRLSIPLPPPAR